MKTIWKYPLEMKFQQTIAMPIGRRILSCGLQPNKAWPSIMVWVEVDMLEKSTSPVDLFILSTGHNFVLHKIPDDVTFLGTLVLSSGALVTHLYYRQP